MTGLRHLGAAVAAAALLVPAAATPAHAAPDVAPCTGVWVVVEGQRSACASEHATGQQALTSAGFTVEDSSPGMLCRIGGRPDTCTVSPSGYWSYWQAPRNAEGGWDAWTYSQLGYTNSHPTAGAAEGWVFGDGRTPPAPLPATDEVPADQGRPPEGGPANAGRDDLTGVVVTGAVLLVGGAAVAAVLARRRRP